jgi:membrane-bound metal-dependent hydrolase YbcI (DUF457 family)
VWVRRIAQAVAACSFAFAALLYFDTSDAIDIWPWKLTPLTSQVIGSFTAQVGVGALLVSLDPRWSAWKLIVQAFLVATALLLVGAVRASGDFDTGNVMTYLYLGGLVACDIALVLLYRSMARQGHPRIG